MLIESFIKILPEIPADPVNGNALPPPPPLPVLTVIGNVVPLPLVNVIVFDDTDAVTIAFGVDDAVKTYEAVAAFVTVPSTFAAVTYEAVAAFVIVPIIFPITVKSLGIVTVGPDNGWIIFALNVLIVYFYYTYQIRYKKTIILLVLYQKQLYDLFLSYCNPFSVTHIKYKGIHFN